VGDPPPPPAVAAAARRAASREPRSSRRARRAVRDPVQRGRAPGLAAARSLELCEARHLARSAGRAPTPGGKHGRSADLKRRVGLRAAPLAAGPQGAKV